MTHPKTDKDVGHMKPCPFCGRTKQFVILGTEGWMVGCDNFRCRAMGPVRTTEAAARRAWEKTK